MVTQKQIDQFVKDNDFISCGRKFGKSIIKRSYCEYRSKLKLKFTPGSGGKKTLDDTTTLPYDPTCYKCEYWKEAESI